MMPCSGCEGRTLCTREGEVQGRHRWRALCFPARRRDTMKAIVQDTYGSPDGLELRDIDRPVVGDDDVLVRVRAAGVDQGVWHLMAGLPYLMRIAGVGLRAPKNPVTGHDVAGTVETVGKKVTAFQPGDEVFGVCRGSFAEYACAREDKVAPKPANLAFEQAAAVPISACTASRVFATRERFSRDRKC